MSKCNRIKKTNFKKFNINVVLTSTFGLNEFEKKITNYIKLGYEQKALKMSKKKLGNLQRAKKKIDSINHILKYNN
ncbi:60S ribosomal protein L36 [Guillardia theta]|uniref:60S ribosomal protein L36 n=1 Tax=Guillardia theta TaxID=55529 RepID=Q9AW14_GUITH|nr:60S ribosomal protein L36 [Guillardia theta]CAC27057.1 60S ribosomal protein L36 [Guillardia theta]